MLEFRVSSNIKSVSEFGGIYMSENCTHNCSTCGESCKSRTAEQTSF